MGAHEKGPGRLSDSDKTLDELIASDPEKYLGQAVADRFDDRLPFLFKILDVREMLSIQVHPNKQAAERGFAREEREGPPRDAPDRNYRDDNHKPELGVALTDFYLLHGFRPEEEVHRTLQEVPGWTDLIPTLENGGLRGLYARVMEEDQSSIDRMLTPLINEIRGLKLQRDSPRFWAARAVEQYSKDGHHDRGIFSIFFFNLVKLSPGEAIFQDAGIPHAYLEGVCIELMANSDNVLRGGLTPKHIDVPELMDKTLFETVSPRLLTANHEGGGWETFGTPAPDFKLQKVFLDKAQEVTIPADSGPSILLLMSGEATVQGTSLNENSRTVFVPAGAAVTVSCQAGTRLYRAAVGDIK